MILTWVVVLGRRPQKQISEANVWANCVCLASNVYSIQPSASSHGARAPPVCLCEHQSEDRQTGWCGRHCRVYSQ